MKPPCSNCNFLYWPGKSIYSNLWIICNCSEVLSVYRSICWIPTFAFLFVYCKIHVCRHIVYDFRQFISILNWGFMRCKRRTKMDVICQRMWLHWQITLHNILFCVSHFSAVSSIQGKINISRMKPSYFL
jgi:hypothetical protein